MRFLLSQPAPGDRCGNGTDHLATREIDHDPKALDEALGSKNA
jgi:hypothetical protein